MFFKPEKSPWGPVKFYSLLFPEFYYVSTDIQDGYLFSRSVAESNNVNEYLLSSRSFEDSFYAFPASTDAMMLAFCSKTLFWNIYRNYCVRSDLKMTFTNFFKFAKQTVNNMFPLASPILSDSIVYMDYWVREAELSMKYLWKDSVHPFYQYLVPLYIPDDWHDGSIPGDVLPAIESNDYMFRIYFSNFGVPYYLTVSNKYYKPDVFPEKKFAYSSYDLFDLLIKAKQIKEHHDELNQFSFG